MIVTQPVICLDIPDWTEAENQTTDIIRSIFNAARMAFSIVWLLYSPHFPLAAKGSVCELQNSSELWPTLKRPGVLQFVYIHVCCCSPVLSADMQF